VEGDIHDMGVLQPFLPDLLDGGHVNLLILGLKAGGQEQQDDEAER
jgi:hypothetical protein